MPTESRRFIPPENFRTSLWRTLYRLSDLSTLRTSRLSLEPCMPFSRP